MAATHQPLELPLIDFSEFLHPTSSERKQEVVDQIRAASEKYGFFQLKGHGIPLESQKALLQSLDNFFSLPKEEKMSLSFLEDKGRRGYECSGDTLRDGDALPDSKEAFYIGREDPTFEPPGFYCPNQWPSMPEQDFHGPVWRYYEQTSALGRSIWEALLLGLGESTDVLNKFAKRPIVQMKMIRYPGQPATLPGQFGVGAHTDFGGVTVLLQQPDREGLEVWLEDEQVWVDVPANEDVYIINCGDMVATWSGRRYRSAKHRVVTKSDAQRLSCATFWHGDSEATNPLDPTDKSGDTVGKLCLARFRNQFSIPKEVQATPVAAAS